MIDEYQAKLLICDFQPWEEVERNERDKTKLNFNILCRLVQGLLNTGLGVAHITV